MFTPKAPPRKAYQKPYQKPKIPCRPKEIEFEVGTWKVLLSSDGMVDIEGGPTTWDYVTTHINYNEAKLLGKVFISDLEDPLITISSKDWEEIKRIGSKYLDNKAFL